MGVAQCIGAGHAALRLGHFGVKFHRSGDGGNTWEELPAPAYPWLMTDQVDAAGMAPRMKALRMVGVPYADDQIAAAEQDVSGHTEMEALIAYLQVLGTARK